MPAADPRLSSARALVDEAVDLGSGPRTRGGRPRLRAALAEAIALARAAETLDPARARGVLARAYALVAEDALHGATQLSQSAQRAPTPEDCDDGWRQVAAIVAAATEAGAAAQALGEGAQPAFVQRARTAAARARALLDARNHAYTFHADPGFSFGEGWYVAAAAVLGAVSVQIEPDRPLTAQAEAFLRAAGLADRLVPHRPRPRANKPLPVIVARAFGADPVGAQRAVRAAFLGDAPVAEVVQGFVDARLASAGPRPKVLLWIRVGGHQPARNSHPEEVSTTIAVARAAGLVPVLVGDALPLAPAPDVVDFTFFWKDPLFRGVEGRRAQLQFFEHLRARGVVGQVGVTTAGMDGPALLGMPTMYLTDAPNPRLGTWVGAVPGYEEIVRAEGAVEARLRAGFARFRAG